VFSSSKEGGKWNFSITKRRLLILNAKFIVSGMAGLKELHRLRAFLMTKKPSYSRSRVDEALGLEGILGCVNEVRGFNSITASETFSTAEIQVGKETFVLWLGLGFRHGMIE
jgi:hypothetical protein